MTLVERFTRARRRLAGDGWNRNAVEAVDARGRWCPPTDEAAHAFSLLGAFEADGPALEPWEVLDAVAGGSALLWEQDPMRTTSDVQRILSTAIARAAALERRRGRA